MLCISQNSMNFHKRLSLKDLRDENISTLCLTLYPLSRKETGGGGGVNYFDIGPDGQSSSFSFRQRHFFFFFNKLTSSLVDVEISTLKSIAFKINLQT